MRTSGVAIAFLALRSRIYENTAGPDSVCGALQATGATDLSGVAYHRILILDPASSCCFNVRRRDKNYIRTRTSSFACKVTQVLCSMAL